MKLEVAQARKEKRDLQYENTQLKIQLKARDWQRNSGFNFYVSVSRHGTKAKCFRNFILIFKAIFNEIGQKGKFLKFPYSPLFTV